MLYLRTTVSATLMAGKSGLMASPYLDVSETEEEEEEEEEVVAAALEAPPLRFTFVLAPFPAPTMLAAVMAAASRSNAEAGNVVDDDEDDDEDDDDILN